METAETVRAIRTTIPNNTHLSCLSSGALVRRAEYPMECSTLS